jgi:hypothetical protein
VFSQNILSLGVISVLLGILTRGYLCPDMSSVSFFSELALALSLASAALLQLGRFIDAARATHAFFVKRRFCCTIRQGLAATPAQRA